jgi:hypothetical protein
MAMSVWAGPYPRLVRPGHSDNACVNASMNSSENNSASPSDKDGEGVRIIEHGSGSFYSALLYKLLAVVLVICLAAYVINMAVDQTAVTRAANNVASNEAAESVDANDTADGKFSAQPVLANSRAANHSASRDPNDLANYVAAGEAPKMEEVIQRLHEAGIHSGLGAFNPPGTSPPMIGLAVPDDYVLPQGYVRHFQATDDGQRIEPILMYSPDFEFFDSAGQSINIPDNRVVPDNMAPPGLAIRPIKIPDPLEPGGP